MSMDCPRRYRDWDGVLGLCASQDGVRVLFITMRYHRCLSGVSIFFSRRLQPNAPNAVTGQPTPGVTANAQPTPAATQTNAFPDPENPFPPQPADPPPPVHLPYTHLYSRYEVCHKNLAVD